MTIPLALDWLHISTWLLIGAIFWNEAWPLDWLEVPALGSLLLVWFDAWLRALDLDIRFEALDLSTFLTVSRFCCLPFWYSDTLVQSGLLVQERLIVDLWVSWCRFCTAISYLVDIFVAVTVGPWILIDALRFWLKHFFYLFARLLTILTMIVRTRVRTCPLGDGVTTRCTHRCPHPLATSPANHKSRNPTLCYVTRQPQVSNCSYV
jgi:hypothetical protein